MHKMAMILVTVALVAYSKLPDNAISKIEIEGISEYHGVGYIVVDAQRISTSNETKFKGNISNISEIPLGYKVEVNGYRMNDGSILAAEIEAENNEKKILEKNDY